MAFGEFECVLTFQGVGSVVAFQRILRVVKQHANIGTAILVNQPKSCAFAHQH